MPEAVRENQGKKRGGTDSKIGIKITKNGYIYKNLYTSEKQPKSGMSKTGKKGKKGGILP